MEPRNLLEQLLLDPKFAATLCTCQVRNADARKCAQHAHLFTTEEDES